MTILLNIFQFVLFNVRTLHAGITQYIKFWSGNWKCLQERPRDRWRTVSRGLVWEWLRIRSIWWRC